jgi:hypothetical protein
MKPAATLQVKGNPKAVYCGRCNTVLATIVDGGKAAVLLEGYFWTISPYPHFEPNDRLIRRHAWNRDRAWRDTPEGQAARERIKSGKVGGVSHVRVTRTRADGSKGWQYWRTETGAGRDVFQLYIRPADDTFHDPVNCLNCKTLNAVPPDLLQ